MKGKIIAISLSILFIMSATSVAFSLITKENLNQADQVGPIIDWQHNFGGNLRDYGRDGLQTDDGYIFVGSYNEAENGWIIKTDSQGNLQWDKKYGTSGTNYFRKILPLNDGYLVGGTSNLAFWIVKIDKNGNIDWSKNYSCENSIISLFLDFAQAADNGFVLVGSPENGRALLIKIDEAGEEKSRIIYDRYPDDFENTRLFDIDATRDNGFICAGYTQKKESSDYDFFLLKLDENLNEQWNKTFDSGTSSDWGRSVVETNDGYIMVGNSNIDDSAWAVKSDLDGNFVWDKKYGQDKTAYFIEKLNDGNYIVTGEVETGSNSANLWVLKIDGQGNEIWSFETGGKYKDYGSCVRQTSDGGYIVIGTLMTARSGDTFDQDFWIIKLIESSSIFKPEKPEGSSRGKTGEEYVYSTSVNHPDGLNIQFGWDWNGDNVVDEWTEFYPSGETIYTTHKWDKDGAYLIKVKAKDIDDLESQWSEPLAVTMPRTHKIQNFWYMHKILDRFQILRFIFSL